MLATIPRIAVAVLILALGGAVQAVDIEWVTVFHPGNTCDPQPQGCFGSVDYTYRIGKYEVTNAQYAEFLNAVAKTDTNDLYSASMGSGYGGITRSGSSGSYTYSAITGRENMPVNYVSFWDSLRFANWLHNSRPTGAQDSTTTEDGAYDMSLTYTEIVRKAGAKVFLTSEDEWYKAAYYVAAGAYRDYPAGTDVQTTCATPGATANTANCDGAVGPPPLGDLTDAGSYTGSPSPNGTFDQGGNVWEWNESRSGTDRGLRGGNFMHAAINLAASTRIDDFAWDESSSQGFRVASPRPICGNGTIEGAEVCDDGGTMAGDGCDENCEIEPGWSCEGEPSVCTPLPVPSISSGGLAMLGGLIFSIAVAGLALQRRPTEG